MNIILQTVLGLGFLCCAQASTAQSLKADFETPLRQLNLFPGLMEISGLAENSDQTVFAHNDEHAIVYELDIADGTSQKAFALGDPTIQKDFEGIEVYNGRIYLLSSRGKIYEAPIGEHKSRVKYNAYDTGVGDFCETEGLSRGPDDEDGTVRFFILCKSPHNVDQKDRVLIYLWSLRDRLAVSKPWLDISRSKVTDGKPKKFNPSAIAWSAKYNQLFILSAKSDRFASLYSDGTVIQKAKLDPELHQQAEGISITSAGQLIISDEGKADRPPRLTVYNMQETEN